MSANVIDLMLTDFPVQLSLPQLFDHLPDNVLWMRAVRKVNSEAGDIAEVSQNPVVDFIIDYANLKAKQTLLGGYQVSIGTSIRYGNSHDPNLGRQMFKPLSDVLESGTSMEFEYFNAIINQWFWVTYSRAGDGVLGIARSLTTPKAIVLENERRNHLFESTLNASLSGVIAYEAVRESVGAPDAPVTAGQSGRIRDFRSINVNSTAVKALGLPDQTPGWLMMERFPGIPQSLFDQYVTVVETGQPLRFEIPYEADNVSGWYDVAVSKLDDGFVITFNDITDSKRVTLENERQRTLLDSILNTSLNTVFVYEAIRDQTNHIQDFSVRLVNERGRANVQSRLGIDVVGKTLLTINPDSRQSGQFELFCQVIESGQSIHTEQYYPIANVWYNTSITKLNDGIVVMGNDITEQKQAARAITKSATDLQNVIDSSQTGIFVFSPIFDEAGQHIDFRFKTINRMVAALVGQTPESLTGAVASDWFVSYRETGLFDRYRHTYKTGEEQRFEINYNVDGFDVWFDVKAIKFGDDVLVTFTDYTSLKQAQKAVERQANLLNSVLNGSINGIMAFEAIRDSTGEIQDFAFLSVNEAACQLVGKSAGELLGTRLLSTFPGNKQTGLFDKYVQTVETGEPARTETYYNHDGLDFWLDISAQKLDDGFVVTFTDVSVLKRATLSIERSADELRTVIDTAQVAIFLINPVRNEAGKIIDFRFRTANQMIASYVGQEPDALTGELVSRWFPAYLTNGLFNRYVAIFETGRTQHFNFHFEADIIDSWENYTVVKIGNDVLVTFSDYTELKKLQQRLEASATELQTVVDTCQTGIFLFSPVWSKNGEVVDFRFRLANRQLASYVGQEPERVIGALGSTWFPDYKTNGLFDAYYKTYATGESQRFDFHYNGSGIDVWLDIMTTKSGNDVLVTFGDYTPLKQLQQQLENSVVDLQRSNKNLEQFAYVASHDLQEPLRKIQAFGDIIKSHYAPVIGTEGADIISRMQSAAARMQVLIKDVLAYSRIATKRETVGPINLNDVVDDVLNDLETAIADKQADIKIEPLPTVRGDEAQLRQLFQNLISNALKFTKTGHDAEPPVISLTSRRVFGRDLSGFVLSANETERSFYLIEVIDNGIGFDPKQAARIFQVFQRLHNRSEYQGTGIGLAIVEKVVDNHQGYIVAEGRPGQGATFRILLPV